MMHNHVSGHLFKILKVFFSKNFFSFSVLALDMLQVNFSAKFGSIWRNLVNFETLFTTNYLEITNFFNIYSHWNITTRSDYWRISLSSRDNLFSNCSLDGDTTKMFWRKGTNFSWKHTITAQLFTSLEQFFTRCWLSFKIIFGNLIASSEITYILF